MRRPAPGWSPRSASYPLLDLSASEFYYSSFGRSYQLLTGVAVMALCRRFGLRDDRRWLAALGAAGLILLAAGPGLTVTQTGIVATVCAAACVLSSRAVLFESRWVERIGVWSFGIYLWHFPISLYLTHEQLGTSPATVFVVTFVTSTALSAFTFRFFEDPIRHVPVPNFATFATTAVVIAGLWGALGLLGTSPAPKVYVAESGPSAERVPLEVGDGEAADLRPVAPRTVWRRGA